MRDGQDHAATFVGSLALWVLLGALVGFHWDLVLRAPELAPAIPMSEGLQRRLAELLPTTRLLALAISVPFVVGLIGAAVSVARGRSAAPLLRLAGHLVLLVLPWTLFDIAWLILRPLQYTGPLGILVFTLPFLHQIVPAAHVARILTWQSSRHGQRDLGPRRAAWLLAIGVLLYGSVFATLSVLQYHALMVPHGDTAMYEEHLWNLLHGKGFRSQLDGGRLFLGEHIEFIHVFLIPVYILYPCLPTLNVVYSFALGLGAVPVYGLVRAAGATRRTALLAAIAYLLYPPLEYLNLEASLKTFRPENLAVPLVLTGLWAIERRRPGWAVLSWVLALTAKEDYAIPLAALGVYLALQRSASGKRRLAALAIAVGAIAYLWFAVAVAIPYFRGGPPHYMAYYPSLGRTPAEIVRTVVVDPARLWHLVLTTENANLIAMLLVPLAVLPLLAPARMTVSLPSAAPLILGELPGLKNPMFHFHGPLVPLLFWALSGAFRHRWIADRQRGLATFLVCLCFFANLWWGKSPLSVAFWDPHSGLQGYYGALYVPGERVERFWRAYPLVPQSASVAATDYVRPRFTHHRECHEIGAEGLKPHVRPEQVDYLFVDLRGPYSDPDAGRRVPETIRRPGGWLTAYEDEYFLVVRAATAEKSSRP